MFNIINIFSFFKLSFIWTKILLWKY
jgi:hypothetical protein